MLDRVLKILDSAETAGPVSEQRVVEGERALGVRFPTAYREFLLRYGAAMGEGWTASGIDPTRTSEDEPPLHQDVVQQTLADRSGYQGQFHPHHLIQVAHDGMSLGFYLDLSSEEKGDCPVVGLGPGIHLLQAAPTFVDFLIGWSKDQLTEFPRRQL